MKTNWRRQKNVIVIVYIRKYYCDIIERHRNSKSNRKELKVAVVVGDATNFYTKSQRKSWEHIEGNKK